jgi:hypothetical protein
MPFDTPVALLTFARPAETARVLHAIRQMRPRTLLVVSDGAREGRPDEAERVAQTRALLDTIDWDCDLRTNFAPTNMGCRRRVSSGLDWVFQQVDRAIILEDDCLPSPAFFQYCAEMLERYQDNPEVMTISGMTYFSGEHRIADSYHFSRYPLIWGWGSWARAWRHYDVDMKDWPQQKADGLLRRVIGDRFIELRMEEMFDHVYGGFDTWDVQLLYASVKRGGLNAIPVTNMILNIGYGELATHTTGGAPTPVRRMQLGELSFPLIHPASALRDSRGDRRIENATRMRPRLKRLPGFLWTNRRRLLSRS